jgi:hypothetical protein
MKIILYYQTFTDITPILVNNSPVTHIHVAATHFGTDDQCNPYIHLNNYSPYNEKFDKMWYDMEQASKLGIEVKLMIGGAGGAFTTMFSDYNVYYSLLKTLLKSKSFISGVDLDVEETTDINNIKKLIVDLKTDFENNFSICLAPIQYSLQSDVPGMGGFSYKELVYSPVGKYINYLNGQFYDDYTEQAYIDVINNNYNSSCIVMGMDGTENLEERLSDIHNIYLKYGDNFGGVFLWEYCNGDPKWAEKVKNVLKKTFFEKYCSSIFKLN